MKIVILALLAGFTLTHAAGPDVTVPFHDLDNIDVYLDSSPKTVGSILITHLPAGYLSSVKQLQVSGPECIESNQGNLHHMEDGSTRKTWATHDLDWKLPKCLESQVISRTFDDIHRAFVIGLTKSIGSQDLSWETKQGEEGLSHAHFKDHIHLYTPGQSSDASVLEDRAIPFHVDNGLYLLLTPHPIGLLVKSKDGTWDTSSVQDGVILLFGKAMSEFLNLPRFQAAQHAVPTITSQRVVYSRMRVAPLDAVKKGKTFQQVFLQPSPGKGLFVRQVTEECNNATNTNCWMACAPIPPTCQGQTTFCARPQGNGTTVVNGVNFQLCLTTNDTSSTLPHGKGCDVQCAALWPTSGVNGVRPYFAIVFILMLLA
jgi:hypothetical protein